MSILNMALLSIILTVAHMPLREPGSKDKRNGKEPFANSLCQVYCQRKVRIRGGASDASGGLGCPKAGFVSAVINRDVV